ncbi:unnamed protein product [Pleuronectes platessa]|uniref:Uncharacterized protein n=1 Tax=Pleuronectes platessa TaxID=8262 RepID=A0A9N7ZA95_PLEPL|nr:unnamed protein product [Pleuronectes platessa]
MEYEEEETIVHEPSLFHGSLLEIRFANNPFTRGAVVRPPVTSPSTASASEAHGDEEFIFMRHEGTEDQKFEKSRAGLRLIEVSPASHTSTPETPMASKLANDKQPPTEVKYREPLTVH